MVLPLYLYAVHILSALRPSRQSNFVSTRLSMPFKRILWRRRTASNQPQRRGRPVVAPNSWPRSRRYSPVESLSSVVNGPSPTRVVYAFTTPNTLLIFVGPIPAPVQAPPAMGFEEVT